jgi:hypothetical protein
MRHMRLLSPRSPAPARLLGTVAALVAVTAPAAAASVSLPSMPARLGSGDPCTAASTQTAEAASWAQQSLSPDRARQLSTGAGVTVAVVDTGVATGTPALSGRVTALGSADQDCVGHGTFVAGLIAAGPSEAGAFEGVAPQARILAVRGTDERGAASAALVADGIRTAAEHGAGVIEVSAALTSGEDALTAAVRYAAGHGALVIAPAAPDVAASGAATASAAPARRYWPASAPGALSVVGVAQDGTLLAAAKNASGARLAAPGGAVVSIGPRGSGHYIGSGSSLAAAYAAGAAALVRAYHPDLSAAQVASRLVASAAPAATAPRLDPYGAVSLIPGSAAPAGPAAAPTPLRIAIPSGTPRHRALVLAGAATGLVLLVGAAAVVIPLGRRRGWRPAGDIRGVR